MSNSTTFIDKCLNGDAFLDEIDNHVDEWHESETNASLESFLGFSQEEYAYWVSKPEILPFIIASRKEGKSINGVLCEFESGTLPIAARSRDAQTANQLILWLKSINKL